MNRLRSHHIFFSLFFVVILTQAGLFSTWKKCFHSYLKLEKWQIILVIFFHNKSSIWHAAIRLGNYEKIKGME